MSVSFRLSWNSDWGNRSSCGSASCFGLRCEEESQDTGDCKGQPAQYAIYAQPAKLQVK